MVVPIKMSPSLCNAVVLNAKSVGVERQSKLPLILGGVGWNPQVPLASGQPLLET